jgi:hypothetical protein
VKRTPSLIISAIAFSFVTPSRGWPVNRTFAGVICGGVFGTPNPPPVAYCGGPALGFKVEAHGDGFSSLGALAPLFLQKTIDQPSRMHGCLTLSTPEGDHLIATYDGTVGGANAIY